MNTVVRKQLSGRCVSATGFVVSILITLTCSCGRQPVVTIDGNNPPTFKLDHRGKALSFAVYEIVPKGPDSHKNGKLQFPLVADTVMLWKLEPDPDAEAVNGLQSVSYGRVPPGFVQKYPNEGPPSALLDGKFYGATATTDEPNELSTAFAVVDGKAIAQ